MRHHAISEKSISQHIHLIVRSLANTSPDITHRCIAHNVIFCTPFPPDWKVEWNYSWGCMLQCCACHFAWFVSLLMACSWNHTAKTSLGILLNAITCDKKASFCQRFHHHIYTLGQILDLQSLAERRLWKSAKKRIDALTPYLCHVVCLAMIVFVYEYMQWFSEEKKK